VIIPVKVKLPSGRENFLSVTPVTLTYSLGGITSSLTKSIGIGESEVLFEVKTEKISTDNDQILSVSAVSGGHFKGSVIKEIKILSSRKPLELLVEEKYNQVYGGVIIPVKVKLPSGRENFLSVTPVTLTYSLGGITSSLTKSIGIGESEVTFDVKTKSVSTSRDQILTISTVAGDHFAASAIEEIKVLSPRKPLELV
jgi:hypothetical protein